MEGGKGRREGKRRDQGREGGRKSEKGGRVCTAISSCKIVLACLLRQDSAEARGIDIQLYDTVFPSIFHYCVPVYQCTSAGDHYVAW